MSTAVDTGGRDGRVFSSAGTSFKDSFNRSSFQFEHNLADAPLFDLPRLAELAAKMLERGKVRWQNHDTPIDAKWHEATLDRQQKSVTEAINNLQESGSWVLIYSVQADPEYDAVLQQILSELEVALEIPLREQMTWQDAYIFLGSPGAVTPYHIDHESTFLFQMRGRRTAQIWDQADRSVLSESEIENYYLGHLSAASYKPEKIVSATTYDLRAGTGVHHPSCAPHAFTNGTSCSVALGVHFCLKELDRRARVYQLNSLLRRVGLRPTAPGVSAWRDTVKASFLGAISTRKPKTKNQLLRSGIHRLLFPAIFAHRLRKRLRSVRS